MLISAMSETPVAGYELRDTESRNLLNDFDTEAEALGAVRELIALNGSDCASALAVTRIDVDGRMTTLAMGTALATSAERGRLRA